MLDDRNARRVNEPIPYKPCVPHDAMPSSSPELPDEPFIVFRKLPPKDDDEPSSTPNEDEDGTVIDEPTALDEKSPRGQVVVEIVGLLIDTLLKVGVPINKSPSCEVFKQLITDVGRLTAKL